MPTLRRETGAKRSTAGCTQGNGWAGQIIKPLGSGRQSRREAKGADFNGRGLERKRHATNYFSHLTIIIIVNNLSLVVGSVLHRRLPLPFSVQVISMAEQLSTSKCDSPLLQAFVDNRSIRSRSRPASPAAVHAPKMWCRMPSSDSAPRRRSPRRSRPSSATCSRSCATWPSITTASRPWSRSIPAVKKKA